MKVISMMVVLVLRRLATGFFLSLNNLCYYYNVYNLTIF